MWVQGLGFQCSNGGKCSLSIIVTLYEKKQSQSKKIETTYN